MDRTNLRTIEGCNCSGYFNCKYDANCNHRHGECLYLAMDDGAHYLQHLDCEKLHKVADLLGDPHEEETRALVASLFTPFINVPYEPWSKTALGIAIKGSAYLCERVRYMLDSMGMMPEMAEPISILVSDALCEAMKKGRQEICTANAKQAIREATHNRFSTIGATTGVMMRDRRTQTVIHYMASRLFSIGKYGSLEECEKMGVEFVANWERKVDTHIGYWEGLGFNGPWNDDYCFNYGILEKKQNAKALGQIPLIGHPMNKDRTNPKKWSTEPYRSAVNQDPVCVATLEHFRSIMMYTVGEFTDMDFRIIVLGLLEVKASNAKEWVRLRVTENGLQEIPLLTHEQIILVRKASIYEHLNEIVDGINDGRFTRAQLMQAVIKATEDTLETDRDNYPYGPDLHWTKDFHNRIEVWTLEDYITDALLRALHTHEYNNQEFNLIARLVKAYRESGTALYETAAA